MEKIGRIPIKGYEGFYEVSLDGVIYSVERDVVCGNHTQKVEERRLKPILSKYGYHLVSLSKDKKSKQFRYHRIIAQALIPNPDNKPTVDHIDGCKTNNHPSNLRWATNLEQTAYARKLGLLPTGNRNKSTKLREEFLPEIKNRIMLGDLIQDVAKAYGVNRNTVRYAMNKKYGNTWDVPRSEKLSRASKVRWSKRRENNDDQS